MECRLSVIIPVYNAEKYLRQCLDSVLSQDYDSYEVLLVDDGSTDASGAICDEYAERDERVTVLHQDNMGHTAARQNGFRASEGGYIIMIDSDDWIERGMFRCMMEKALADDADIVQCNFRAVKNGREIEQPLIFREGLYDREVLEREIYPRMIYAGGYYRFGIAPNMWNKIWKRQLVEKYLFRIDRRIRSGEDGLLTFSCFYEAQRVWILNTVFYDYRSREDSMCRLTKSRMEENHILFAFYKEWLYHDCVLAAQIEHYAVYQTLQAADERLGTMRMSQFKRQYAFLREDCLERRGIRKVRIRDVSGKRNKLILLRLKLWMKE